MEGPETYTYGTTGYPELKSFGGGGCCGREMMEGSPESLEEKGPIRCLRMAGALLRMDGEPLAATWLNESTVLAIDDQGIVEKVSREGGRWNRARPLQLDQMPNLANFFQGDSHVVCSVGSEVGVWPLDRSEPLWWLETESWVTAVAGHKALGLVASGHEDGSVRFWDAATGNLLRCWRRGDGAPGESGRDISISALAWHPADAKVLVADESLALFQLELETTGPLTVSSGHKGRVVALGFDPKDRFLYSGGWDGTVRVWDAKTGAPVILLNNHASLVTCLSVGGDGATLCVGDNLPSCTLWDVPEWRIRGTGNPLPAEPRFVEMVAGGAECLATFQDNRVLVLNLGETFNSGTIWSRNEPQARPVCLKESESSFLCLGLEGGIQKWAEKKQGSLWDGTHSSQHVGDFGGPLRAISSTVVKGIPALLTSQTGPGILKAYLWADAQAYELAGISDCVPGEGELVALAPGGSWAVCASERALDVAVYQFPGLQPVGIIPDPLEGAACQDLAFGPCGQLVAICGVSTFAQKPGIGAAVVVDAEFGKIRHSTGRGVWRLAWHPKGQELMLSAVNGDLVRWRPEIGVEEVLEHTADGPMQVIGYSADGNFAVASPGNEELWIYEAGRIRPSGTVSLPGRVIAVSPGKKGSAIAALLAGGDGWEIDLPEWLSDKASRLS